MKLLILINVLHLALSATLVLNSQQNTDTTYLIDLPTRLLEDLSNDNQVEHEYWHPRLAARRLQAVATLQSSTSRKDSKFVSFLALKETLKNKTKEELTFYPGDGSDAQTKLESKKQMNCECKFVRYYENNDTDQSVDLSSIDDIFTSNTTAYDNNTASESNKKNNNQEIPSSLASELLEVSHYNKATAISEDDVMPSHSSSLNQAQDHQKKQNDALASLAKLLNDKKDDDVLLTKSSSNSQTKDIGADVITALIETLEEKKAEPSSKKSASKSDSADDFMDFMKMYKDFEKFKSLEQEQKHKAEKESQINEKLQDLIQLMNEQPTASRKSSQKYKEDEDSDDQLNQLTNAIMLQKKQRQQETELQEQDSAKAKRLRRAISTLLDE